MWKEVRGSQDTNVGLSKFYTVPSPSLPPPQVGGSVVPRAVGCIPFSPENKMDQPQLIWDLESPQKAQAWWPTAPCQLLSTSFHSYQAVMPADSWHGREPKITQTAGVRGCHGHSRWDGSQDTWNPVLATGGCLMTLGVSLLLWAAVCAPSPPPRS